MSLVHAAVSPLKPIELPDTPGAEASEHGAFLLLCDVLAATGDEERQRRVATIIAQPDAIAALIALAERERVLPALHEAIAARHGGSVQKAYRAVLATRHEANRRRNGTFLQVLRELGEAGASAGWRFVALKGAAWLIEDEVGCAPWRQMIDLDVLVDPEHFEAVPRLLKGMGYAPASKSKRFEHNFHLAPYRHPSIPALLEVHRHVGWRHHLLPSETVLAGARPMTGGLLLPAPWTRALHAIIHWQIQDYGGSRGTLPLKELMEVARFLARTDVDWATLSAHAARVGAVEACEAAIAAAATLLNAPVPREIPAGAAARRWVARSIARRASPLSTWVATQLWRAGTLWWCEKVAYRCALRGIRPSVIVFAVWGARIVRLPLLAARATGIAARAIARFGRQWRMGRWRSAQ